MKDEPLKNGFWDLKNCVADKSREILSSNEIISNFCTQRREDRKDAKEEIREEEIGSIIVDAAVYLHKKLGSGLFENVYELKLRSTNNERWDR